MTYQKALKLISSNNLYYIRVKMVNKLLDYVCLKVAGVVGVGIHLYSITLNNEHFNQMYQDFVERRYIQGSLKAFVPFILPYGVSYYSRRKAQKESREKIKDLERRIKELE